MIKSKKGFSLLELILVLGIASAVSFMKFQDLKQQQENIQADAVGQQIKQVGDAVNGYINIRYDKLSTLTSVSSSAGTDPGPRTCSTADNTCTITYQTLINEGLLPTTFNGINTNHSAYSIILRRSGNSPNYVIDGLITTTTQWKEGDKVRYDLLGKAMQAAGVDSGMTKTADQVAGYSGQWTEQTSDYKNITNAGLLAYRVGYSSAMYSVYLRRDGTLPMTGDFNMGGKSINNAANITASGTTTSGTLKSTGLTVVGGALTVAGASTLAGAVSAGNNLTVAGSTNLKGSTTLNSSLNVAGATTLAGIVAANNTLTVAGPTNLKSTATVGSTLTVGGALNANNALTVAGVSTLRGATSLASTLSVAGASTLNGALTAKNAINASGNITSSGQVKGATVASTGRMTTGEYLQINGTATAGASCSPNGLQGKSSTGVLLSCVSSKWTSGSGTTKVSGWYIQQSYVNSGTTTSTICVLKNSMTNACSCSSGTTGKAVVIDDSVSGSSSGSMRGSRISLTGCQ
ncbi:shufflon system plasmid conjugative transfer pilus tip adhesin PilV [Enterobacter hormaechei subsp. xiangfangensis]|uniref:shufflon system plasmid conjugative transfer pilus tip adhesin PilV n=1 Tax=Enterobacteriaceae TaxID=543 RepID=UPI00123A681A|nr:MULTISPECIES: shufflon system plasmid conjugative transfer pilus tip adhesin PilV [Enterobacteriaceae]MBB2293774.1 shufflon system plasmid conjugative transfer pilus tip adhesin PilV [Escherichia coli]MCV8934567.1 shufflon system plasmid conjugative transfer pilus tip adhesin PilV [Escherichia coli]QFH50580.1 shufflon system plasmid conjugative transfer pilus tip adhesin PilV [Leclercia adecarboxylata]